MGKIVLFDFDLNGADSIQHLIDAKLVEVYPCHSFPGFLEQRDAIKPTLKKGDLVIIDTFTSAVDTTRMNTKIGTDRTAKDWEMRSLYVGAGSNSYGPYNYATDVMQANVADILSTGATLITVAHEDAENDPLTLRKKRGPKSNPAAVDALIRKSSDVVRLVVQEDNELDDEGKIRIAAGERILNLRQNGDVEMILKMHVARDTKVPARLKDPTLAKLREHMQKTPTWLTIYGAAGVGKTTLATSDAQAIYEAKKQPKTKEPAA